MSDNIVSQLTSDDDDDETSKDLMTFSMQLIHHSQWKTRRAFVSGSKAEVPHYHLIAKDVDVSYDALDIDLMIYDNLRYAVHRSVSLPETFTGDIIRICTEDVHAGYVRLIIDKANTELYSHDLTPPEEHLTVHGPAKMTNIKTSAHMNTYSLKDIYNDVSILESEGRAITSCDLVLAVHSPFWPVEATEWITRRRSHGFPSKSVIKRVVRYGCDFVQVSHNRLSNDGEWRFSFSRAELFIAKSWSISQRIVYDTLWVLNKRIASSNLCSYYFKTLMFWACEEKPTQFWHDEFLVNSVCQLLIEMQNCLKSKLCLNYFIPGNNMMDHLIDKDLSHEIDALWRTSQLCERITEVIEICRRYELRAANSTLQIHLPAWIKRAFFIYWRIYNIDYDNYTDLYCTNLTEDLQNALYVELSDIYRGLCAQQKSVSCVKESDKNMYCQKSEHHLLLAVNLCESRKEDIVRNCSLEFYGVMVESFLRYDTTTYNELINACTELNIKPRSTADRQSSLDERNTEKCLLYSRSVEKRGNKLVSDYSGEKISEGRNASFFVLLCDAEIMTKMGAELYKEWPGRSPTVNLSWFIAKAYLANLYYTTKRDVSLTLNTCSDIIFVYRQSKMNHYFAEKTFPVVLSTQWTSIYDKEIQALLGFYSLCSYVFGASSRSVYLGVCPVQFAIYIQVCAMRGTLTNSELARSIEKVSDVLNTIEANINRLDVDSPESAVYRELRTFMDRELSKIKSNYPFNVIDAYTDNFMAHVSRCDYDSHSSNGLLTALTRFIDL